eukprot:12213159-Alexandrium_andersonii.AAC.1
MAAAVLAAVAAGPGGARSRALCPAWWRGRGPGPRSPQEAGGPGRWLGCSQLQAPVVAVPT